MAAPTAFALAPGDIAFTGFNADGDDNLAFVALASIPAGTEIFFTDDEWNGQPIGSGGAFVGTESEFKWTAPAAGVDAGTIVYFDNVDNSPTAISVSAGTVVYTDTTNTGISNGADTVYAFQGASNVPTGFVASITNGTGIEAEIGNTGLVAGDSAVVLPSSADGGRYIGARTGQMTFAGFRTLIGNVIAANWETTTGDATVYVPFSTTTFTTGAPITNTLTLSVSPASFLENSTNPANNGTVTRSEVTASDLVVTLTSPDTSEVTVPATVTILANQASATFDVTAQDDNIIDGNQNVTLTASAPASNPGTFAVTVQDDGDIPPTPTLTTGAIAFTTFNADRDAIAFVALNAIPANEVIYFNDNEWNGSAIGAGGAFIDANEGVVTWTAPVGGIAAGAVVVIDNYDKASILASVGTATGSSGLSATDESIYAYQGTSSTTPSTFLAFIANHNDGSPDSIVGTGLTSGSTALFLTDSSDFAEFTGFRSGQATFPAYLAQIANLATNWSMIGTTDASLTASNATSFTISPPAEVTVDIAAAVATAEGDSGSSPLAFAVTRSLDTTAFSVDYAVTGGSATPGTDFTVLASGTLSFTANSGPLTQNITVDVLGDTDFESDDTIVITLSNLMPTSGTTAIGNATGTGTITNDDVELPLITTQPDSTTLITGKATTLVVVASGTPTPTIQWYQGNSGNISNPVSGATSAVFLTPVLSSNTSYWARATSGANTVDSATATVSIVPAVTSVDLTTYVRVGRHNLPHPSRDPAPANNLLAEEASGVAYNWDTDTLFVIGDGGQSITQVTKTGVLVNTMTLALGSSAQGTEFYDPEGITYIGGGEFVFTEERDRQAVKFTYAPGTTLLRSATQTMKLGTTIGNIGLEGLCYDPQTSGFLFVKESAPLGIFQTTIDFTLLTASNGSPTTVNSTNLFDPALAGTADMSDVFAFSNIPSMVGQPQAGNLLIISQESAKVVNIDRAGSVASSVTLVSDPGNISIQAQTHEGVVMDPTGLMYVVSEAGGGTSATPQVWVYETTTATNLPPTAVVLNNIVTSIPENTNTTSAIKVADIAVTDDGLGTNTLSLTGTDASFFEITGNALFLKAGTALDFLTKPSYSLTVQVDDTNVGATPDATVNYSLSITAAPIGVANLIISEVAPWSSGNSTLGSDWFEVTNIGATTANITGWKVDDNSATFANSAALVGITSIAPGESVIFIESATPKSTEFTNIWFGGIAPPGLQIGTYTGSMIGLGTTGDAVNLFDSAGIVQANVVFGANAPTPPGPYFTFDNAAGANNATITTLSSIGVNGAYSVSDTVAPATTGSLIGSPGTIAGSTPIISIVATDATATEDGATTGTFRVSRTGSLIGPLTANFTVASGVGQATAADFTPTIGTSVVIPSSSAFVDITVTPVFDSLGEGNETVTLTLFDTGSYDVGSPDAATVTIADSRFGTWLAANGFTSSGLAADTDGDCITDGVEFFFNSNPNNGGGFGNFLQIIPNAGALELDFTRLTDTTGVEGELMVSSDLNTWTDAILGLDYTVLSSVPTGDETAFTYALPGTGPSAPGVSAAYTAPNTTAPFAVGASLGGVRVVNEGLVGVGRIDGDNVDQFGETMGAASGLFINAWAWNGSQFTGKFNILPDRGYNTTTPSLFSNYAARLHEVDFSFVPYYGTTPVAQGQIAITDVIPTQMVTTRFTYQDGPTLKYTTGLNPTVHTYSLLGNTVGVVNAFNVASSDMQDLLSFDAEAVHLFDDGSGFVSDEYGTYIARFNASKQITGITQLPAAARPHSAPDVLNFTSLATPVTGRRQNQGLEGMSVTPDGTLLFAVMQSALVQDTNGSNQQTRNNTRLFVYNVAGANRETPVLIGEYVVKLPQFNSTGTGAVNRTAAQSEIIALNSTSFLMLPRDGNGLGTGSTTPITFKSVQLVDFASASNILGTYDAEVNSILVSGSLNPAINAAASKEVINMLNPTDLAKFGLNTNTAAPDANTLNEKMEGMALVPDLSTTQGNDFFLFVANDNDFQAQNVQMLDAAGAFFSADGRSTVSGGQPITNDAMFYAYRITIDADAKKFFRMDVTGDN